jgi:glutathione synthase/RimK-type ligase-like ATP-grasp enzyme
MFRLYPYKQGSRSVRSLKDALEGKIIRLRNSIYRPQEGHVVINWGNSRVPEWWGQGDAVYLNDPDSVAVAANKLSALNELSTQNVPTVDFTMSMDTAQQWLDEGEKVFARQSLTGHSGEGIVVQRGENNREFVDVIRSLTELGLHEEADSVRRQLEDISPVLEEAQLYTKGVNNHGEYRVHVFQGDVILYQKKSRKVDEEGNVITAEGEEADVRNLASNWVYRTGNLKRLERIEELAVDAVAALHLDFGAVDIIKDENGDVFVLEVNTAAGLGNTQTLEAYTDAFNSVFE